MQTSEEVTQRYAQSIGQSVQIVDAEVAFAPLDRTGVRAIKARQVGQLLLADPLIPADLPDPTAERATPAQQIWRRLFHPPSLRVCRL